jgi:probable O-glycosylation ligase (exosortase A-associated)
MPFVVVGRYRIHALVVMLCLGLGFHGIIDGLKFLASGGGHIVSGFSKFGDNNHFAVMLAMAIPLLFYLSKFSANRLIRWACLVGVLLVVAAVVGTRSRGGFLCLVAVGLWLILSSGQRAKGLVLFSGALAFAIALAPDSWTERMDTIKEANQDSSFMSRVEAWQVSSSIALHNPVLGGGFHAVQVQSVWDTYRGSSGLLGFVNTGEPSRVFRAAHSVYFEVMGDLGFVGFLLFMGILVNAISSGIRIRRMATKHDQSLVWAAELATALNAAIVGFLVGGASVSIAYSEVIYILVMLMEILRIEVSKTLVNPGRSGHPASTSVAFVSQR